MTICICQNCNCTLADPEACFCSHCGVRLAPLSEECYQQQECRTTNECPKACAKECAKTCNTVCAQSNKTSCCPKEQQGSDACQNGNFSAEDVHSFALRVRERITRMYGNPRRGFRSMTDGTDCGAISRDGLINAVRSTWGFAAVPKEFVAATVDRYLTRGGKGAITYDMFSEFVTKGPEPLNLCSDEQTVLSNIVLPIQESFLRKHYTPHAAFLNIASREQGYVTIAELRKHIDQVLRVASLHTVSDETFKDVIQRSANITGDKLNYQDFARMMSYPYFGQKQWRQVSTSPQRVADSDNHPYRRYY